MFPKHRAAQTEGSALPVWICTQLVSFAAAEKKDYVDRWVKIFSTSVSQILASSNDSVVT